MFVICFIGEYSSADRAYNLTMFNRKDRCSKLLGQTGHHVAVQSNAASHNNRGFTGDSVIHAGYSSGHCDMGPFCDICCSFTGRQRRNDFAFSEYHTD